MSRHDLLIQKLKQDGLHENAIACFIANVERVAGGDAGLITEESIHQPDTLTDFDSLDLPEDPKALLQQTAILKLNGGLGTGMGLDHAKSLIPVKDQRNFLDFTILQLGFLRKLYGVEVPLILMNSFSTSADTMDYLRSKPAGAAAGAWEFLQSRVPKLNAETLEPVEWPADPSLEWCPPGHGDLYLSLANSGMLQRLLDQGKNYLFVSNSDNLGATTDLRLLAYFAHSDAPFLMEVADRTEADRKGGHLAVRKSDGRFILRESAQCPPEEEAEFQDIERHRYFNTNNLWMRIDAIAEALRQHGQFLPLPLIRNQKTVDPKDKKSTPVLQLETAMGAAIELFQGATAVRVPRSRFAPVKTTADLLALRSDVYETGADFSLRLIAERNGVPPTIRLDDRYYKTLENFDVLFPCIPSLRECKSLSIQGPAKFSEPVEIAGKVSFTIDKSEPVLIEAGRYESKTLHRG